MFCGEVVPMIVNVSMITSSRHVDEVQIITEARATNIAFDPNLEDKVLLDGKSIVMNQGE